MTRLSEIEARLSAATRGPWVELETETSVDLEGVGGWQDIGPEDDAPVAIVLGYARFPNEDPQQEANATLIANAPSDIEWMAARIRKLEGALRRARPYVADLPIVGDADLAVIDTALTEGEDHG